MCPAGGCLDCGNARCPRPMEKKMKHAAWAAAAALCSLPAAAPAVSAAPQAAAAEIVPGMAIVDNGRNPVGRVEAVQGADLIIRTDRHQARLPRSSFTLYRGQLLFGMTRDQLNAEIERTMAAAQAQIAPGAAVRGAGGGVAGTIETIGPDFIVLRLTAGQLVRVPRSAVAGGSQGPLIGITAAELRQLVVAGDASNTND